MAALPARARCLARSDPPAGHRRGLRRQEVALSGGQCARRGRPAGEAEARRRAGFEVRLLSANSVRDEYGIPGRSGLLSYHNLEANPRRLAVGFLRVALARGARFYAPVEALAVEPHTGGVAVLTDQATIRARHVVFATGYELPKGVPRKGHRIATTWAIATRPQPRGLWPGRGFIWEASDPYLYLRVGPDGRVICGGEDETFSDAETRDALSAAR